MSNPFDDLPAPDGGALDPSASPFTAVPGQVPPALTGRDPVVQAIDIMMRQVAAHRPSTVLFVEGPRGMGKTSLLVAAADAATRRGLTPVRLELRGDTSEQSRELVQTLQDLDGTTRVRGVTRRITGVQAAGFGVGLDPADTDAPAVAQVVAAASHHAGDTGQPLLLLVDETQMDPKLAGELVRGLHRAFQDTQPVAAVLAGLPGAKAQVTEVVSYTERFDLRRLEPLDATAAIEAIRRPLTDHGVQLADDVAAQLPAATSGYPYFIQIWGAELWAAAQHPDLIDQPAFDAAAPAAQGRINLFLSDRWARVPDRRQRYLVALAEHGTSATTRQVADTLGATHEDLSMDRHRLILDGLLYAPRRGEIAFTIPPLAAWIRDHHIPPHNTGSEMR